MEGIEKQLRNLVQEHITPQRRIFLIKTQTGTTAGKSRTITSVLGEILVTSGQAKRLQLKKGSRWSPFLEKCCLLVSANESDQRASEDIETLTGIKISHSTLHRMVGRQEWEEVTLKEPTPRN